MRGFEAGLLQRLDRLILRQVKRQQLCITKTKVPTREVDGLLLDAAEGDELRQLSSSSHEDVSAVAEVVADDAVQRRGLFVKGWCRLLKVAASEVRLQSLQAHTRGS